MNIQKKVCIAVLVSLLSGCSFFSPYGTDNTPKPAELTHYPASVKPAIKWEHSVGNGSHGTYLRLAPTVASHTIYTVDDRGVLTATNTNSGNIVWQKDLRIGVKSGIGTNGTLLALVDDKAELYGLDAANGKTLWKAPLSDQALAAPTITDKMVITKTIDGAITAFDLNGKMLWQYTHDVPVLMLRAASSVLVAGNVAYVGFSDGVVVALDLQTGNELWQQVVAEPQGFSEIERMVDIDANLVLKNNHLFVATYQGKVSALNPQTGAVLWQQGNSVYAGITANDTALFAVAADGTVSAYDQVSGKSLWQQKALTWRFLTGPTLFGNSLVVGDLQGYLQFIDPRNGVLQGRIETYRGKTNIIDAPLVDENQLMAIDTEGYLVAVTL